MPERLLDASGKAKFQHFQSNAPVPIFVTRAIEDGRFVGAVIAGQKTDIFDGPRHEEVFRRHSGANFGVYSMLNMNDLIVSHPHPPGVVTYPAGATFGPRVMRDYEFVWIIEGDCEYRYGPQTFAAPAGSIVLCRPGETDFFRWDRQRRTQHAYFHFNIQRVPSHWPATNDWPLVRRPAEGDALRPVFRHVIRYGRTGDSQLARLSIMQMLTSFVLGQIDTGDIPRDTLPEPVERTWMFIQQRLDAAPADAITLDDLAEASFVTKEHLCRVFSESTRRSPMETVRLARLDRAMDLLARSNYAIGQIAEMCGFASAFHFSRRFKDAYGQSPRALRTAIRDGTTPPSPGLITRFGEKPVR